MELYTVLNDLEKRVVKELEKMNDKGDLNPAELKTITDAVCLLEKIHKIQDESEFEYSETRRSPSTGRYMSNGSYRRGYSGHSINDRIVDKLEHMMDEAGSDYERDVISRWIAKVEAH